ncbi:MAG: hypothetical protein GF308_15860 [Candidatus Heimdallarchaeota archaeon]|nr:hypothetical protein [Candidatus Heimdallarchaeota archaeon]
MQFQIEQLDNQTGILKYLLLLYTSQNGALYNQEFIDHGMNDRTAKHARNQLRRLRLIIIEERIVQNRTRLYSIITDKGRSIAAHLYEVEQILQDRKQ